MLATPSSAGCREGLQGRVIVDRRPVYPPTIITGVLKIPFVTSIDPPSVALNVPENDPVAWAPPGVPGSSILIVQDCTVPLYVSCVPDGVGVPDFLTRRR